MSAQRLPLGVLGLWQGGWTVSATHGIELVLSKDDFIEVICLQMLALCGGQERTQAEFSRLLQSAGLELEGVQRCGRALSIVRARPV